MLLQMKNEADRLGSPFYWNDEAIAIKLFSIESASSLFHFRLLELEAPS
jgi:hypothetical protein